MNPLRAACLLLPLLSLLPILPATAFAQAADDPTPIACGNCAAWNRPQAPFNVVGNTWYVGTAGLSSVLITGPQGHILIDGALPQSAPLIARNIAALGFRIEDVRLIVNSHPHFDHAGGIAWLQRRSGAQVAAGQAAVPVLTSGETLHGDPQYKSLEGMAMPKIAQVRGVRDGETLTVGPLRITAHLTPGHTPGGATWSWRACERNEAGCRDVVYADSLNAVSDDDFHFTDAAHASLVKDFRASIAKVAGLPCDVLISAHPDQSDVLDKAAARTRERNPGHNPFIAPGACRAYADAATRRLDARVAAERAR
jgi:metallo-beta-lactamase class B